LKNNYCNKRTQCPSCQSIDLALLHKHKFESIDNVGIFNSYDVSSCNQCGMIFANNIPSQAEFDGYYKSASKYETANTEQIVEAYYPFVADCVGEAADIDSKIMDIGCGYGATLRELQKRGFQKLTGVDPSQDNISNLSLDGINGINNTLFSLEPDKTQKQDCIFLSAVLEHIVDLKGAMKIISDLTADNGVVFITVPDAEQFLLTVDTPYREFSVEHINFFTISSLCSLFALYGFVLQKQWEFPTIVAAAFKKMPKSNNCITEYIDLCNKKTNEIIAKTQKYIKSGEPVLVWGTGTLTQYLLANTDFKKCNIMGFVDSNVHYHTNQLFGKQILSPYLLKEERFCSLPIIISTYAHSEQIKNMIVSELRLNNQIVIL